MRVNYTATYDERAMSRLKLGKRTHYLCYLTPACRERGETGYLGSIHKVGREWVAIPQGSDGFLRQNALVGSWATRQEAWEALAEHATTTRHGRNAYRQAARLERSRALAGVGKDAE